MASPQGMLLLCVAVVVAHAADHWVNITSNGVSRPTLLHVPPTCEQKTGSTCRLLGCGSGSGTCSGFPSYECICDDGMCGVGGTCWRQSDVKLPLVVSFHPMGMNPELWAPQQGMSTEADKRGFIVAYPQGLEPAETVSALIPGWPKGWLVGGHTWNAGSCCPGASRKKTDDVQFTRDLLDQLKGGLVKKVSNIDIDPQRVYACGGSNGAFLTLRLACEAPELFAAIVPVAGVLANQTSEEYPFHDSEWPMNPFRCAQPRRPVPTLIFQGDEDILVPWIGEPVMGFRTPEDNVRVMKGLNGIPEDSSGTVSYEHGNGACTTYGGVASNVTICRMHKMGHAWPTTTAICKATEWVPGSFCETDIDATAQAWAFFEKYKLESSSTEDIVV